MKKVKTVGDFLMVHYSKRVTANKRYSLRAFARDLGVSSGRLTNILSGRNSPSILTLERIRSALQLTASDYKNLLQLAESTKSQHLQNRSQDIVLTESQLGLMTDWLPFAILSLTKTEDFSLDPRSIGKRLNVPPRIVEQSIQSLREANLLVFQNGEWGPTKRRITTSFDIPSSQLQLLHQDRLKIAATKLKETEVELRDYSSITFAADTKKLAEAKKIIAQFRRQLAELLESGDCQEVYSMNIQLYPLSSRENL